MQIFTVSQVFQLSVNERQQNKTIDEKQETTLYHIVILY